VPYFWVFLMHQHFDPPPPEPFFLSCRFLSDSDLHWAFSPFSPLVSPPCNCPPFWAPFSRISPHLVRVFSARPPSHRLTNFLRYSCCRFCPLFPLGPFPFFPEPLFFFSFSQRICFLTRLTKRAPAPLPSPLRIHPCLLLFYSLSPRNCFFSASQPTFPRKNNPFCPFYRLVTSPLFFGLCGKLFPSWTLPFLK